MDLERQQAVRDGLESLKTQISDAETVGDVPALTELYNTVRTSGRSGQEGRYVALYDYDADSEQWDCRSVEWLESGTHYRDTGADLTVPFGPMLLVDSDTFLSRVWETVANELRNTKQNIAAKKEAQRREQQ